MSTTTTMRSAQRLTALQESRMKSIIEFINIALYGLWLSQGRLSRWDLVCAWWLAPSPTFTALCGEDGEVFTHGEVVVANLLVVCLCVLLVVVG